MKLIKSLAASLALVACTSAFAATVTVNWSRGSFTLGDVGTITSPFGSTGADAGRFVGTITATSGISPTAFHASPSSLLAYCFDLAQLLSGGSTYTVANGAPPAVLDFLGAANHYLGGDPYAWLNVGGNASLAAAIQLGIWEGLYDGGSFNLTAGAVSFAGTPASVVSVYNNIVALMPGAGSLSSTLVMVLTSASSQDVITGRRSGIEIPEPGSLALFGVAVVAAGLARRRKR